MDTRFSDHVKSLENAKIPDDAIVKMLAKKGVIVTVEDVKTARGELASAVKAMADAVKHIDAVEDLPAVPKVAEVVADVAELVEGVAMGATKAAEVAADVGEVARVIEAVVVEPPRAVRVTAKGDGRVSIPGRRPIRVSFKGVHIGEEAQLLWEHARHLVEPFTPKR